MSRYVSGAVALASALAFLGCSSSSSSNGTKPPTIVGTGATVSQPVTAAGGTVTLQGSSITIPPGALAGDQTITIQSTTNPPPSGVTNLSPIYQFGPDGLVFNKPVTIQLTYTSDGNPPAFAWTDLNSTSFSILPSTVSGGSVSAQVTHFSQGFVADGTTTTSLPAASDDAGSVEPDATVPADDSGTGPADDATAPGEDSGNNAEPDSGGNATDAGGNPTDAGANPNDSGGNPVDSGGNAADSGGSPGDAGSNGGDGSACAVCSNGFCEPACAPGSTPCGSSTCVSTDSDPSNCGSCGHACGTGETCIAGGCVLGCSGSHVSSGCAASPSKDGGIDCSSCGAGYSACGSQCTQTDSDQNNCGACGNACTPGQTCTAGTCTALCTGNDVCAGGACVTSCPSGQTVCGTVSQGATGFCTSTQSDFNNCGACGHACGNGQQCVAGTCVASCYASSDVGGCGASPQKDGGVDCSSCGTGFSTCGMQCAQLQSDPNNCGACGNVCAQGQTCSAGSCTTLCSGSEVCTASGTCAASCPAGSAVCNALGSGKTSVCNNLGSDPSNCGSCGHACGSGEACLNGACTAWCNNQSGGTDAGTEAPDASSGGGPTFDGSTPPPNDSGSGCIPNACQPGQCGTVDNGCGGPMNCGPCGGDGGTCNPIPPQQACGGLCGVGVSDGCGSKILCPPCGGGDAGSGGGDSGTCLSEGQACGAQCGISVSNGCGGEWQCPSCGGGGDAGGGCSPAICQPGQCGTVNDGCGGTLSCGACNPDAGKCAPLSEGQACAGMACGSLASDGCGGVLPCPPCGGGDAGSAGDAGQTSTYGSPCTTPGGPDPACGGLFDLCENNGTNSCTKSCTYTGGGNPIQDPAECPPPSSGICLPKGYCK